MALEAQEVLGLWGKTSYSTRSSFHTQSLTPLLCRYSIS